MNESLKSVLAMSLLAACTDAASDGARTPEADASVQTVPTPPENTAPVASLAVTSRPVPSAEEPSTPPNLEAFKPCTLGTDPRERRLLGSLEGIVRGAVGAYEREQGPQQVLTEGTPTTSFGHALCKSAEPVPRTVPNATPIRPSPKQGEDFQTGDKQSGWMCLKFLISNPLDYQYGYRQGGGYLGPARGLPNASKHGFEASAVADLDGDGKTSLYTKVGWVDTKLGTVRVGADIYCADSGE